MNTMSASCTPQVVNIPRPDDWHLHLRDGALLKAVLPYSARHFARAIVMPNLKTPVRTTAEAAAYRDRILAALPDNMTFTPLMTAYLTDTTDPDDLTRGFEEGILTAAKLYPAGATTNSDYGVTDVQAISNILDRLQQIGMPLSIHGEVSDSDIDIFDREAVFIDRVLVPMRRSFPELKIVLEHLTTRIAVDFVLSELQTGKTGATITPHHLLINRNDLLGGGIRPHHYCHPIVKTEADRQALILAATSGAPMFFAGTDSAPHPRTAKESATGPGGIFCAPFALAIYAEIFEKADALGRLADFLSFNGPAFYGLPVNAANLTLEKQNAPIPPLKPILTDDGSELIAFPSESRLSWRVVEKDQSLL